MSADTKDERRERLLAHLPDGSENRVGRMTAEETVAVAVLIFENLTLDEVHDVIMATLDVGDRTELVVSLEGR